MSSTMQQTDNDGRDKVGGEKVLQATDEVVSPDTSRGEGELLRSIEDGHHTRADCTMIQRALKKGWINFWNVPQDMLERMPQLLAEQLQHAYETKDKRNFVKLTETLRALQEDNRKAAELVDRTDRLDAGKPTDSYELQPVIFPGMKTPLTAKRDDGSNDGAAT